MGTLSSIATCSLLALLSTCGAAVGSSCGPSVPSGFVVAAVDGSGSNKAAACLALNMRVAQLTAENANEASSVIYSCLGELRYVLVGQWQGNSYETQCLTAYVSTDKPGLTVAMLRSCPDGNSVLCAPIGTQSIQLPSTTTSATITARTTTTTSTTRTTTTSTALSLPTGACFSTDERFVTIPVGNFSYTNAETICQQYGTQLARFSNLSDVLTLQDCMLTTTYLGYPVVPGAFDYTFLFAQFNSTGDAVNSTLILASGDFPTGPPYAICQHIIPSGPQAGTFVYVLAGPLAPFTLDGAIAACASSGMSLATYPITNPTTPIENGIPSIVFNAFTNVAMPLPGLCAQVGAMAGNVLMAMAATEIICQAVSEIVSGVICTLPQLP